MAIIRNDATSEKKYYNGKLAEVVHLDDEEIWVRIEGDIEDYKLKKEVWENKTYTLDSDKNIKEDVLGSFEQYPIRLAWAVTIHKSQGLTFDRLIIDAGKSFASGQVYVALSRCRTLEGIVLKSKITADVIFSDHRVEEFQSETNANEKVEEILQSEKFDFAVQKVLRRTDCSWIRADVEKWYNAALVSKNIDKEKAKALYFGLKNDSTQLLKVFEKFEKVLLQKTKKHLVGEDLWSDVETKSEGAVNFFFQQVNEKIFENLKQFYAETKGIKGLKQFNEDMRVFLDDVKEYLDDLKTTKLLEKNLFKASKETEVSLAVNKKPSQVLSFELFQNGKTIPEIAKERGLVNETIYGHLAKYAEQGNLDLSRVIPKEKIKIFEKEFKRESEEKSLGEWKKSLTEDFQFYEIRILINHFTFLKNNTSKD